MKWKKIGPCKVLERYDSHNAYKLELPEGVDISPIFNVVDLYPYHREVVDDHDRLQEHSDFSSWVDRLPERQDEMVAIDKILDRRIGKETRNKKYFEYLVSWKDKPIEEAVWMDEGEVMKLGVSLEDLKEWF